METGIYIELSANDPRERSRSWGYVLDDPMTAALGKIEVESAEMQPKEIMEDWVEYLKSQKKRRPKIRRKRKMRNRNQKNRGNQKKKCKVRRKLRKTQRKSHKTQRKPHKPRQRSSCRGK